MSPETYEHYRTLLAGMLYGAVSMLGAITAVRLYAAWWTRRREENPGCEPVKEVLCWLPDKVTSLRKKYILFDFAWVAWTTALSILGLWKLWQLQGILP